jgi:hypothetical protein
VHAALQRARQRPEAAAGDRLRRRRRAGGVQRARRQPAHAAPRSGTRHDAAVVQRAQATRGCRWMVTNGVRPAGASLRLALGRPVAGAAGQTL